jgi:spermidine/putrescine transport system ATP-binding protein
MTALLSVQRISKTFQKKIKALDNVSLEVKQGEFVALLGPSGCGKTTLLATLGGFLKPDAGSVFIDGNDVTNLPPHQRTLNTVFQNYALFPHMTVMGNVSYGPLRAGLKKSEALGRALEALNMVGLEHLAESYPAQMSGGQRQRVALARAIVNRPKLLLLDEPLSSLDLKLRKRMQFELKALQIKLGISFIFVTHDQEEAMAMADRIVVMSQGRIEQIGSGDEIYKRPNSRFVAEFIGDANLLACDAMNGQLKLACCDYVVGEKNNKTDLLPIAMIRPENIILEREATANSVQASVKDVVSIGSYTTIYLDLNGTTLEARRIGANDLNVCAGDILNVQFNKKHIHLLEA